MLFKDFSIFSSGGHFVQPSRAILAILVEGHKRNISFLKSDHRLGRRQLKIFILLALVAILFKGAEPFE